MKRSNPKIIDDDIQSFSDPPDFKNVFEIGNILSEIIKKTPEKRPIDKFDRQSSLDKLNQKEIQEFSNKIKKVLGYY